MATQRIPGYNEFDFANAQLACSMLLGMDTIVSKFNAKARKLRADFARWSRPAP